jgi:hypothetical protein
VRFEAERDLVCNAIARLKDWGLLDMTGGAVNVWAADGTILVTQAGPVSGTGRWSRPM